MTTFYNKKNSVVLEYFKRTIQKDDFVFGWSKDELHNIGDLDGNTNTLLIIYPKGQRPQLPYPQNKKEK